jgi:hypothetical protein
MSSTTDTTSISPLMSLPRTSSADDVIKVTGRTGISKGQRGRNSHEWCSPLRDLLGGGGMRNGPFVKCSESKYNAYRLDISQLRSSFVDILVRLN